MDKNVAALQRAKQLIDLLCDEMERDQPLHNVQAYLTVALENAKGNAPEVKEIQNEMGMTSSALSRALGNIGEWSYRGKAGLDLIKSRPDYTDRRRKPMVLTPKGEKLATAVAAICH